MTDAPFTGCGLLDNLGPCDKGIVKLGGAEYTGVKPERSLLGGTTDRFFTEFKLEKERCSDEKRREVVLPHIVLWLVAGPEIRDHDGGVGSISSSQWQCQNSCGRDRHSNSMRTDWIRRFLGESQAGG